MVKSSITYAEVDAILNLTEEEYVNKIPSSVITFLKNEKDKDYKIELSTTEPLEKQNISREAISFLMMLHLNYCCESEEEKQGILKKLNENEVNIQNKLAEKYNPDNLFKKKVEEKEPEKEMAITEYKKANVLKRIFEKIAFIFRKIKNGD